MKTIKKLSNTQAAFESCLITVLKDSDGLTIPQIKATFLLVLENYFIDKSDLRIISLAGIELYHNFNLKILTQGGELDKLLSDAVEIDDEISTDSKKRKEILAEYYDYFQKNLGDYGPLDPKIWQKYRKGKEPRTAKKAKALFSKIFKDFKNKKISAAELSYLLMQLGNSKGGDECFNQDEKVYKYFFKLPSVSEVITLQIFTPQKLKEKFKSQLAKMFEYWNETKNAS